MTAFNTNKNAHLLQVDWFDEVVDHEYAPRNAINPHPSQLTNYSQSWKNRPQEPKRNTVKPEKPKPALKKRKGL